MVKDGIIYHGLGAAQKLPLQYESEEIWKADRIPALYLIILYP